jgi:D-alanyl-D-alanine carboxypeptidase/D-alanyl-D-alanine-endopeptidase (penicillin-binding protein 4)
MTGTFYGRVHPDPFSRLLILLCGLCLLGVAPASANALTPTSLAALQGDLRHQLHLAGPHDGAYVYDVTAKQALFSERATALRPPASVEKLFTATAALERMGPTATLETTVLGAGRLLPGGVWEGNIYLHGGGDPTFGSSSFIGAHYGGVGASVSQLVTQIVRVDGIHHITGTVEGDESYFDSLRGEPSSGYAPDPFLEGTLSATAFDRGASGSEHGAHAPAAYAAHKLWGALKGAGVSIGGRSGGATAPSGSTALARVQSPPLAELLGLMLPPSDNFFAETLLKDLGARYAAAGTTAAGAAVVAQTISSAFGFQPRVADGSGLSYSDRTSPYQVADLLVALAGTPVGEVLRQHMAIAGHTGTLSLRMRHTGASGRCQGKTGTLTGVSNLVGYCQTAGGHLLAFAIFTDAISTEAAHTFQDHMAITIADSTL